MAPAWAAGAAAVAAGAATCASPCSPPLLLLRPPARQPRRDRATRPAAARRRRWPQPLEQQQPGFSDASSCRQCGQPVVVSQAGAGGITVFDSRDIVLERSLGTFGFMSVSSYVPPPSAPDRLGGSDDADLGMDEADLSRFSRQEIESAAVEARLYVGRIARGPRRNARVLLKAYPSRRAGAPAEVDAMAANEIATHCALQPPLVPEDKFTPNLCVLLGGFETREGEQWLVFRNPGVLTAADYAAAAAQAGSAKQSLGTFELWDRFDYNRVLRRRRRFILSILAQTLRALDYMHSQGFLHQSIGPASLVLNTADEIELGSLLVRLRDLAFAVDIRDTAMYGGPTLADLWEKGTSSITRADPGRELAEGLWRRAAAAGARTVEERRAYGKADDVYAAGLLAATLCFVPLSEPGSIDGPTVQRLLEGTFRLDLEAARDYCEADDRWAAAVAFLDCGGSRAGWHFLQKMLERDYTQRPSAGELLNHSFFVDGFNL